MTEDDYLDLINYIREKEAESKHWHDAYNTFKEVSDTTVTALQDKIEALEERGSLLEDKISLLERKNESLRELALTMNRELDRLQAENDRLKGNTTLWQIGLLLAIGWGLGR